MDRFTRVLHGRVPQDVDFACLLVDPDIHDMRGKRSANAGWIHGASADNGAAGFLQLGCQFLESESLLGVLRAL